MNSNWIPVFRTGKHVDSAGNEKTWTEADLDTIMSKYQPSKHEAPVVIGHPTDNAPAWGWVESLKRQGQMLYAKLKDVAPEFSDMVRKGLFKKRSISLRPDMSLRHVGFLGAMPPAVKGLPDVAFRACEVGITVEFATDCKNCKLCVKNFGSAGVPPAKKGKEKNGMDWRKWLKSKADVDGVEIDFSEPGKDTATPPAPVDVKALVDAGVAQALKTKDLEFAERQRALEAEKVNVQKREEALRNGEKERLKAEITSFCEGLCKSGKLTPAARKAGMGLDTFMEKISTIQDTVEFSEGDKKVKQTPLEYMKSLLSGAKKRIEFGEVATADKDFTNGSAGEKLSAIVKEKMKVNTKLSFQQAFTEAQMENSQLALEYAAEIKQ